MPKIQALAPMRRSPLTLRTRLRSAWRSFTLGPYSLKDPALAKVYEKLFGVGAQSYAGVPVTAENAFTFSAVFSAVLQISSDVAKLPLNLMKRRPNGRGSDHYLESPLYYLVKKEPNPESTSMVFRRTLIAHALTCHGGYAEIERDRVGRPLGLWILTPDRVEPIRQQTDPDRLGPLVYRIDGRDDRIIPAADMVHIHGLGYDGYVGYEIIQKARQAIGLALAAEKFGATFFGKGTLFGGVMEVDHDIDPEQKEELIREIEKFRHMQDSAWRILVTGLGQKFTQFQSKASDAQLDESRIRQVEEVARFFRMPPHRLGVNTPGTVSYASVEAADLNYYKGPILDWITLIEQEFDRKLVARSERKIQFFKHNANAFLRGTMKERQEALGVMRDKGIINANEWRDFEDMNPQDGSQGDLYLVQSAQVPLDKIGALADASIQPPQAPPTDDARDALIRDLRERLSRAEEAVAAARERVIEIREKLAAEMAAGGANSKTVATLEAALREQQTIVSTALVIVPGLQAELSAAITAKAEAEAKTEAVRKQSKADADAAAVKLAEAVAERRRIAAEAAEAKAVADVRVAELAQDLASTAEERDRARQDAQDAGEAARDAEAARVAAEQKFEDVKQALVAADKHAADRDAATQRVDELESTRASLQQQIETLKATHLAKESDIVALQESMATLTRACADARAEAERQQTARDAEAAAHAAVVAELAAHKQQMRERLTAVIGAHRGLVVDALGRMARREAQQARSKQATPEKLRRWLASFPAVQEAVCLEAVIPAIRTHLAWAQSAEDPAVMAGTLVREHLATFTRQIEGVLESDPVDFHADLDRVLTRWETDHAGQVADALLAQEIRHVQEQ